MEQWNLAVLITRVPGCYQNTYEEEAALWSKSNHLIRTRFLPLVMMGTTSPRTPGRTRTEITTNQAIFWQDCYIMHASHSLSGFRFYLVQELLMSKGLTHLPSCACYHVCYVLFLIYVHVLLVRHVCSFALWLNKSLHILKYIYVYTLDLNPHQS